MKKTIVIAAALSLLCLFGCASGQNATSEGANAGAATDESAQAVAGEVLLQEDYGCLECHGAENYRALPEDHADRTNDMCLTCHGTSYLNNATDAPFVPHNLQSAGDVDWPNE